MSKLEPETYAVASALEEASFALPTEKKEHKGLDMPRDLDRAGNDQLGWYLGAWSALYARARWEVALAEADEYSLEGQIKFHVSKAMAVADAKEKVTVVRARVDASEDIVALKSRLVGAKIRAKLLASLCDGYKKKFDAVSREIGRRLKETEQWSRKHNEGVTGTLEGASEPDAQENDDGSKTYRV